MSDVLMEGASFYIFNIEWSNRAYSGALPNNFEADLFVKRRGELWLKERITIGELLLQINTWLLKDLANHPDFRYDSIDTDANPIFTIEQHSESHLWVFRSTTEIFRDVPDLTIAQVRVFLNSLATNIHSNILTLYGNVNIKW